MTRPPAPARAPVCLGRPDPRPHARLRRSDPRPHARLRRLAPALCALAFACQPTPPPGAEGGAPPAAPPTRAAPEPAPVTASASAASAAPAPVAELAPAASSAAARSPAPPDDPSNRVKPPPPGEELAARAARLFEAVRDDDPPKAADFFFPREPFVPLKDVADGGRYWDTLFRTYKNDVRELHRKHRRELEGASFVGLELGSTPTWVKPGDEYNKIGYHRTFHAKLRYRTAAGADRSLDVHTLISWQGAWYITHLSPFKKLARPRSARPSVSAPQGKPPLAASPRWPPSPRFRAPLASTVSTACALPLARPC